MALHIPPVPQFSPTGEPSSVSQRWNKWKKSFQYFHIASGITSDSKKKSLLLHLVGSGTQEIFDTLVNTGTTYEEALAALDQHFEVRKNIPFERSKFHQAKQESSESIEQYVTRLRQLCKHCEYTDTDEECCINEVI